jgi:hypothetical protein
VRLALRRRDTGLGPPIRHHDQLYAPASWPPGAGPAEIPLARLRTIDGRHFFSVERPLPVTGPDPTTPADPHPPTSAHHGRAGRTPPTSSGVAVESTVVVDTVPPLVLDPSPRVESAPGLGTLPERHQTEVSDHQAMHRALVAMGFHPTTRLSATHREVRLGDVLVSVDEVDGHGTFLTLHRECPDDLPVEVLRAGLADLAAALGVHGSRIDGGFGRLVQPPPPAE